MLAQTDNNLHLFFTTLSKPQTPLQKTPAQLYLRQVKDTLSGLGSQPFIFSIEKEKSGLTARTCH
jgi:hypothetical protein